MNKEFKVIFQPAGRSVFVLAGTVLLEAAGQAGFIIQTPCGGASKCGKCGVRVIDGPCIPTMADAVHFSPEQLVQGYRLACHSRVEGDLVVEIPESALFQTAQKILSHDVGGKIKLRPRTVRRFISTESVCGFELSAFAEFLKAAMGDGGPFKIEEAVMARLPGLLAEAAGSGVTVTAVDDRIVDVEPGQKAGRCCGIAFDIGTTTIVGTLVDLVTGVDLAVASMVNPQTSFGDDVISRIKMCRDEQDGLKELHAAVVMAVNQLIGRLLCDTGIARGSVYEAVFAGNTAMQEILCTINPEALGEIPFKAAFNEPLRKKPAELGIEINPVGDLHVFPQIGGFVGGDTVAGIIATQLDRMTEPALLVDVGTNGEIVLSCNGRLTATSVAAGPAFEGARIINGMRGTTGAIEKVVVSGGDIRLNVIGNTKVAGICGSGLIDIVAELLRFEVIDSTGRIQAPDEVPAATPKAIRDRIVALDAQYGFLLVDRADSASGKPLFLYQKDVRELQLANGAIRAGINILLKQAGLDAEGLGSILLAGAFGNFIRRNNARRIGMLPFIPCERIRFMGNTASFGAKMVLLSSDEEDYAAQVTRATVHVDLSLDTSFMDEFSAAMLFPEKE